MFCSRNASPRFTLMAVATQHLGDSQLSRVNKHLEVDKYFSHTVSETEARILKNKSIEREERKKRKVEGILTTLICK